MEEMAHAKGGGIPAMQERTIVQDVGGVEAWPAEDEEMADAEEGGGRGAAKNVDDDADDTGRQAHIPCTNMRGLCVSHLKESCHDKTYPYDMNH